MDTKRLEEAYMAGFTDAVRYATGTSSYTRSLCKDVRAAYAHGFDAGTSTREEQTAVAKRLFRPQLRLVR